MLVGRVGTLQVFSKGIENTPYVDILLSSLADRVIYPSHRVSFRTRPDAIAGWGYKPSAKKARTLAAARKVPYIALEDGFFRSVGLGAAGRPAFSFVADDAGVYYDPQRRSRLHQALAEASGAQDAEHYRQRARSLISFIRENRLSKYNTGRDGLPDEVRALKGPRVLVIDQTYGDASLEGVANDAFSSLIARARRDHPGASILVKTHPDVAGGLKKGCFSPADLSAPDVTVIAEDINPHALFDIVDDIYVASSGLGFEALLAGKVVHCVGRPWYAGYGLTRDEDGNSGAQKVALEDMFAAACLRYPFYIDPYERKASTAENAFDTLAFIKAKADRFRGRMVAFGISPAKRPVFESYLPGAAHPVLYTHCPDEAVTLAAQTGGRIAAWGSKIDERLERSNMPLIRVEDGFLRSVGLGAGLVPASSLVFDDEGIYYDSRRESGVERLLNQGIEDAALLARAERLRHDILARGLTKYNTGSRAVPEFPAGQKIILVAGQVEDDASIRYGTRDIATNTDLLRTVRERRPEAFIIYKPHPDVFSGYRAGHIAEADTARYADMVCGDISADALLPLVAEVHVMSSLIGFEALLRGRDVFTYGMPFYAGWGLTHDFMTCPRRKRHASLDELVAAALIIYPDYVDPDTMLPCPPEVVLRALSAGPRQRQSEPLRFYRCALNFIRRGRKRA